MPSPLPAFDVRQIPFSRRGSWLDLSPVVGLHRAEEQIHLVSHVTRMHPVLAVVPTLEGEEVLAEVSADPSRLEWHYEHRRMEAAFASNSTLRLRGTGLGVVLRDPVAELTPFSGSYLFQDPRNGSVVLTSYESGRRYRVRCLSGRMEVAGAEALGAAARGVRLTSETWEVEITAYDGGLPAADREERPTFDAAVALAASEFDRYRRSVAGWSSPETPAADLAAYVLWSATVEPSGFVTRETVLMSKHWMDKMWSWDHCFNAIALAPGDLDAAVDQFLAPFDHQDETGALPDSIAHSEVLYNFVKPPIHGWALSRLRSAAEGDLDRDRVEQIYSALSRLTRFWLDERTAPGARLPHYQHGNDSGWDNSTAFDRDRVLVAPDLAAFLLLQLHQLADLADELGAAEADHWRATADRVRDALLEDLHTGDEFVAIAPLSGRVSKTTSLLLQLPIIAAEHLPATVLDGLLERIPRFFTRWGAATQLVDTAEYEADGYWRGPVWAPSTAIVEDGLRRAGRTDLADELSASFRGLCERSGFAENFDALTGEGLRDRAYTWTAAVYLMLAREHAERTTRSR